MFERLRIQAVEYLKNKNFNIEFKNEMYNYIKFVFMLCPFLMISAEEKQKLLEIDDFYLRIKAVLEALSKSIKDIPKEEKITFIIKKLGDQLINKHQTEENSIKRKQNSVIPNKGGRRKEFNPEDYEQMIENANMPEEAKKIALEELDKLRSNQKSTETDWTLNYLNILINLPWSKETVDNLDLVNTKSILNRDHFGLEKVKKRIIEYLAVRKLKVDKQNSENLLLESNLNNNITEEKLKINNVFHNNNNQKAQLKGGILCFNGPPGVGKTSLAKSIADALGKKFYRLALGGIRDESEIRGHRRTYIGSMPGMIIQAINRAGVKNAVILLDEIDKVGSNANKGDVSSALLEVLDPEQNGTFKDHYINTPFDLSKILFICTSNDLENISGPLKDRLEVINLSGYSLTEKIKIAQKYLIPKQILENSLLNNEKMKIKIDFNEKILMKLIIEFSFESGVRQLERNIGAICRHIAALIVEQQHFDKSSSNNDLNLEFNVDEKMVKEVLGISYTEIDIGKRVDNPGVAIVKFSF